jgi:hypothetical protein
LIVFTLHLEKWILHRLLQLYAYRDLLKNLFANSVVFFCIFQWTTSKFYSQPTSYVFLVNVKSVFQPVFANHSIDRVLCILSSRRNWDPPPPSGSEGKETLTGGRGGGEEVPIRTREQTLCYSRYISTLWRQLPHSVYHCPTPQNCTWGGDEVCVQRPWKNSPELNGKICEMWTVHIP